MTGVWVGADRRRRVLGLSEKNNKVYGSNTALPAFVNFMAALDPPEHKEGFSKPVPAGIVTVNIDPTSGLRANDKGLNIPHVEGTEPSEFTYDKTSPQNIDTLDTEF